MASQPQIHVFNKGDYSSHRLVTLPPTKLEPLSPSSLRLRTKILGLTTNNLTYANMGFALGWWDTYPIPSSASSPFNDRDTYATVAGWGYAEVVESSYPGVEKGASVFGYVHVGSGTWDVSVSDAESGLEGQVLVTSPHRAHLWTIYNRLQILPPLAQLEKERGRETLGWDALMQVLFGTGYNLSTYGFAWSDALRIHPSGEGAWNVEEARLDGAVCVVLNGGGKTGMGFAYAARHNRPKEQQPTTIIGVGSEKSKPLLEKCGFYDDVLLSGDAAKVAQLVKQTAPRKVVLLDFGARPGVFAAYTEALEDAGAPLARFFVGGDNRPAKPQDLMKARGERGEGVQVNANTLREKGIEVGRQKYFEDFDRAWEGFVHQGAIKGTKLVWGEGMEGWESGWEAFCNDKVGGNEGLVYTL
ncbi:hypothetical protein DPSP01_007559 [Paraphaeosphaeria sporulosa]|uniref:Uncharacterized protein n=1 Tax=Paraphaeosphaeria sporulosa TaxID=1460663 RepID=A0A177C744_9PLEO|nr:uncharacterized protein CC84DRAFT_1261299 [Paraphaeosphaeria sporulosa]OAG02567.1 hypothetical protein CC84DRAFT_1261299 [Paraphaeosphaeria sporulosa]